MRRSQGGFALIELLIVMAIIGLIAISLVFGIWGGMEIHALVLPHGSSLALLTGIVGGIVVGLVVGGLVGKIGKAIFGIFGVVSG